MSIPVRIYLGDETFFTEVLHEGRTCSDLIRSIVSKRPLSNPELWIADSNPFIPLLNRFARRIDEGEDLFLIGDAIRTQALGHIAVFFCKDRAEQITWPNFLEREGMTDPFQKVLGASIG